MQQTATNPVKTLFNQFEEETQEERDYFAWVESVELEYPDKRIIKPNRGQQAKFLLNDDIDIIIYGGAAGGGKSYAGLLYPLRYLAFPYFRAVLFRRKFSEITKPNGLLDESRPLYEEFRGIYNGSDYAWNFNNKDGKGARVDFAHLQHRKNLEDHKGAAYNLVYFDELTTFDKEMFWYMLSRARSSELRCDMKSILRATTNPRKDSWVKKLIQWYIDEDGFAIKERCGVVRWIQRAKESGDYLWADSEEECQKLIDISYAGRDEALKPKPKSFTFLYSDLKDNPQLAKTDYVSNLTMTEPDDAEMLLMGCWEKDSRKKIVFDSVKLEPVTDLEIPRENKMRICRGWDMAYTTHAQSDYTCGVKIGIDSKGMIYILDVVYDKVSSLDLDNLIISTAMADGHHVTQSLPRDMGGHTADAIIRQLNSAGYVNTHSSSEGIKSKEERFLPFAQQCKIQDKVKYLIHKGRRVSYKNNEEIIESLGEETKWVEWLFNALESFPDDESVHDDAVDACSRAFNFLEEHNNVGNLSNLFN